MFLCNNTDNMCIIVIYELDAWMSEMATTMSNNTKAADNSSEVRATFLFSSINTINE